MNRRRFFKSTLAAIALATVPLSVKRVLAASTLEPIITAISSDWLLAGLEMAANIAALPQFVSKRQPNLKSIVYIGDIAGKKVFADPFYIKNELLVGCLSDTPLPRAFSCF